MKVTTRPLERGWPPGLRVDGTGCGLPSLRAIWKEKCGRVDNTELLWSLPEDPLFSTTQKNPEIQSTIYPTTLVPSTKPVKHPSGPPISSLGLEISSLDRTSLNFTSYSFVCVGLLFFKSSFQMQIPLGKRSSYSHIGEDLLITSCCALVISYIETKRNIFIE